MLLKKKKTTQQRFFFLPAPFGERLPDKKKAVRMTTVSPLATVLFRFIDVRHHVT